MHFSARFTRKIDATKRGRLEKFVLHSYIRGNARYVGATSPISRLFVRSSTAAGRPLANLANTMTSDSFKFSGRRTSDYGRLSRERLSITGRRGAAFPLYAANGVTACGINVAAESTTSIKNVNLVAFTAP